VNALPTLRVRGRVLPGTEVHDIYVHDGRFTFDRPTGPVTDVGPANVGPANAGSTTASPAGWLVPGLVDCHAHLALSSPAPPDAPPGEHVRASAAAHRDAGVLLVREPGSPNHESNALPADLPRVITGGRFLAPPGRYFPGLAREVAPADLPAATAEEAAAGTGWAKLIGDFFTPGTPIEPNWTAADLRAAADAAHRAGARIAIHATHPTTIADAIEAGFDSIEHGTGMTLDLVNLMVERGTAWVPTLLISDGVAQLAGMMGSGGPAVLGWLEALPGMVRAAAERGVVLLAGTDAGMGPHGMVAHEIGRLLAAGVAPDTALAAGSWAARDYLGVPSIVAGAPADLVLFAEDPRADAAVLTRPAAILLRGQLVG
jgi:imidazolonepropionase-like amidohydrolase